MSDIRVGIVGASPRGGWAAAAHLPALAALDGFTIAAVATTRMESARETAARYDVPVALDSWQELVSHRDVDLVVVAVKVPSHAPVLSAAIANGKHVYCEWPLGADLGEAEMLTEAALVGGVVHAVGLQGRHAASTRFVRDLIVEGRLGEVQSVSVVAAAPMNGSRISESLTWATDRSAGVNNLTITGGHVLATLAEMVGEPSISSGLLRNPHGTAIVTETGREISGLPANQVVLAGTLPGGAVFSVVVQGGNPPFASGFHLTVMGTEGQVTVDPAGPPGSLWIADWAIRARWADGSEEVLEVPRRYRTTPEEVWAGPAANVAELYQALGTTLHGGRDRFPDFADAVRLHELIAAVES